MRRQFGQGKKRVGRDAADNTEVFGQGGRYWPDLFGHLLIGLYQGGVI